MKIIGAVSPAARPQTLDGLLGMAAPTKHSTEIYRGTKRTENNFVEANQDRLMMTRFPIGPNRVVTKNNTPEAIALTSTDSDNTKSRTTSPQQSSKGARLGLSGLPLLVDSELRKEIVVHNEAKAVAE